MKASNAMRIAQMIVMTAGWLLSGMAATGVAEVPPELRPWLEVEQRWTRDVDAPVLALGQAGRFDDTHIFAPAVALHDDRFQLWYCGSTGTVAERVFQLGMAASRDGRRFQRHDDSPVLAFPDGKRSVLTPTLLRNPDGTTLLEDGLLRMWFSGTDFSDASGLHTLHEATSVDGIRWTTPSEPLLEHVYAPTVIKTGRTYQMWFVDVAGPSWNIRHASSLDGRSWRVTAEPCLVVDQDWERQRLFYPTVLKIDDIYLMWYGSYWKERSNTTALGFAVSLDGMKWYKHPANPVHRPDPNRSWESHYVTSQSIMRLPDGSLRMWYASRKRPPFVNKYFAINTAVWKGFAADSTSIQQARERRDSPASGQDAAEFAGWQKSTRDDLRRMLGIPDERVPLNAEQRGQVEQDGVVIEKWIFTSEPGSRVPAVLYRPKNTADPMPAIVLTFGHGGSKSQWQYNYAGLLYAKLGLACLALDPIGEEERHARGQLGTRAHDPQHVSEQADDAERLIMGKLLFDTMRGIDFLQARDDIDAERIGVAGNSLGGAKAAWMAAVEPRIKMAIVSGWAYDDVVLRSKFCTMLPFQRMRERLSWTEFASLAAPHCAVLVMNGDADWVIDRDDDGQAWRGTRTVAARAAPIFHRLGANGDFQAWFEAGGGHRPYFAYHRALEWIHKQLGTPSMTLDQIQALPAVNSGQWCDAHNIQLERLYGTPLHQRGATLPDVGLVPTPRERLSCLEADELGSPEFTIEGWLKSLK